LRSQQGGTQTTFFSHHNAAKNGPAIEVWSASASPRVLATAASVSFIANDTAASGVFPVSVWGKATSFEASILSDPEPGHPVDCLAEKPLLCRPASPHFRPAFPPARMK